MKRITKNNSFVTVIRCLIGSLEEITVTVTVR